MINNFLQERKSLEGDHAEHAEIANSSFAVQHAFRKAELCKQLQELTKALAMKEEIASKMVDNERITSMRKQYEVSIHIFIPMNVVMKLSRNLRVMLNLNALKPLLKLAQLCCLHPTRIFQNPSFKKMKIRPCMGAARDGPAGSYLKT